MRQAIANAEVGDEQRGEDPTVNKLQQRVAELFGKEAALWFPGGTMCNFVAIKVHTKPGDAIVADAMAHIIRAESAGVAFSSGVLIEPIATERGVSTATQLRAVDRLQTAPVPYGPPVRLVCVEQTHNFGGGAVAGVCRPLEIGPHSIDSVIPARAMGQLASLSNGERVPRDLRFRILTSSGYSKRGPGLSRRLRTRRS